MCISNFDCILRESERPPARMQLKMLTVNAFTPPNLKNLLVICSSEIECTANVSVSNELRVDNCPRADGVLEPNRERPDN